MKKFYNYNKEDYQRLFNILKTKGARITTFAEMDNNNNFIKFIYFTFEYNNYFYYIEKPLNSFYPFTITRFIKINAFEKRQAGFPYPIYTEKEIFDELQDDKNKIYEPLEKTHNQKIFYSLYGIEKNGNTVIQNLKTTSGAREKEILNNLDSIETIKNSPDYEILRFWHKNGNKFFDFNTKTKTVVG